MSNDPYRDPWRRLFNRNAPPEEPVVAAPTARPGAWERLMGRPQPVAPVAQPATGARSSLSGAVIPPGGLWEQEGAPQGAYSTQGPIDYRSPRAARFEALAGAGVIDPRNILGPDGRIRPEVYALLDQQLGYRGAAPLGGEAETEFMNPAEQQAAQWERTFLAGQEGKNVERSGRYWDPATQSYNVTAEYGGQLLDRFGTARVAQERYRQQVEQARGATLGPQAAYESAMANQQEVARQQVPGRANTIDEARLAAAKRATEQAQMAYNRSRGVARTLGPNPAFTVEDIGRGMTPEQLTAAGYAVSAGYSPEEMEQVRLGQVPRSARTQPLEDYYRALRARGVL